MSNEKLDPAPSPDSQIEASGFGDHIEWTPISPEAKLQAEEIVRAQKADLAEKIRLLELRKSLKPRETEEEKRIRLKGIFEQTMDNDTPRNVVSFTKQDREDWEAMQRSKEPKPQEMAPRTKSGFFSRLKGFFE